MRETDLYPPIKAYLERQGYEVKAEVTSCDVVAVRGDEPPLIVELKLGLSIGLLLQGVDRQSMSDAVYVAFAAGKGPRWRGTVRDAVKLCRRLGLGLMSVRPGRGLVEVHCDPGPYKPRQNARRTALLLREFERRAGDPNKGGLVGRPVVTAYRQDALRLALAIRGGAEGRPAALKRALGVEKAASILSKDYYGWFVRLERGVYGVSAAGETALEVYGDTLDMLRAAE
jgi:hypothetical protein